MKIAVLGAGAWGTGMALQLAQRHTVLLWSREADVAQALKQAHPGLASRKVPEPRGVGGRGAVVDDDELVDPRFRQHVADALHQRRTGHVDDHHHRQVGRGR